MAKAIEGEPSWGGAFALVTFILLAGGIVFGALGMSRDWDDETER